MNKKELAEHIRSHGYYIKKDGKFWGFIIEAHDYYFMMSELGLELISDDK